jgi:hypothetical protein
MEPRKMGAQLRSKLLPGALWRTEGPWKELRRSKELQTVRELSIRRLAKEAGVSTEAI